MITIVREHAPSIIFMDEIDSIGSSRLGGGSGGVYWYHVMLIMWSSVVTGDSEVQRTMLELLNQLDGFEATQSIKVIDSCYSNLTTVWK